MSDKDKAIKKFSKIRSEGRTNLSEKEMNTHRYFEFRPTTKIVEETTPEKMAESQQTAP